MGCEALSIEYYESINQTNKVTTSPPFLTKPMEFEKSLYGVNTEVKKKRLKAVSSAATSGIRSYNPVNGKWLSRDPISEKGGFNLYGFVGNDGVNKCDYLGMADCCDPWFDCIEVCYEFIERMNDMLDDLKWLKLLSVPEAILMGNAQRLWNMVVGTSAYVVNSKVDELIAEVKKDGEQQYDDCLDGCDSDYPDCGF